MKEICYVGVRLEAGAQVFVQEAENVRVPVGPVDRPIGEASDGTISHKRLDPRPSQSIWNHSPDGFEWGYHGSGPAQLALAILLDAGTRVESISGVRVENVRGAAIRLHQEFKRLFVAGFEHDRWSLRLADVEAFVFARGGWTGSPDGA